MALWGTAAPYMDQRLGLTIVTRPSVEVVDHVVPGLILLAVGIAAATGRRLRLEAALLAMLAALWMAATHVPLLVQAAQGLVTLEAALFHSLPGIALLALTVGVAARAWWEDK